MAAIQPISEALLAQYVWKYAVDLAANKRNSVLTGKNAAMSMVWKFVDAVHAGVRSNLCTDSQGFFTYWGLVAASADVSPDQYNEVIPHNVHKTLIRNFKFFDPFFTGQDCDWSEGLRNNSLELQRWIEEERAQLYRCWDELPQLCPPPDGHGLFSPAHLARLGLTSHIAYLGGSKRFTSGSVSLAQLTVIDMLIGFHCLYDALEYAYLTETEDPIIQQYVSLAYQAKADPSKKKRFSCPVTSIEQMEALNCIGYEAAKRAFHGEQLDPLLQCIADRSIFWVSPNGSAILDSESNVLANIKAKAADQRSQNEHLDSLLLKLVC